MRAEEEEEEEEEEKAGVEGGRGIVGEEVMAVAGEEGAVSMEKRLTRG